MASQVETQHHKASERGFTLIEVILSLSILVTLSVAATNMMKSSIDMRAELSKQTRVTHRLRVAMDKLTSDLENAYILNTQRIELNPVDRRTTALFRMKRDGDDAELNFTAFVHEPIVANAHESDQTYVVYKLMTDPNTRTGPKSLYRGETKVLPDNFDQDLPPMKILARNVKGFRVHLWNGEDWRTDQWDTNRGEWRNHIPSMVEVQIEAYDEDLPAGEEPGDKASTSIIKTVIYIPRSFGMKELRQPPPSPRWY